MSEPWKIIASFQQKRIKGCLRIVLNRNQAELKPNVEAKATERYLIWVCLLLSSPSNSKSGSVLWRNTTISSTCTLMSMLYLLQTVLKGRTSSKTQPDQYCTEVVSIGQKWSYICIVVWIFFLILISEIHQSYWAEVARHMPSGLESLKASKYACFAFVCFVCNSHKIQGLRLMFCFYTSLPNRPCHFLLNLKGGVFERRQLDKFVFLKMQRDFSAPSLDLGEGSPWGSRWLTRRWCGRRRRCDAWEDIFVGIWKT